ncbi:MAG: tRNA preQ1(34) S-adenosylmethionine ribosyltransferase-isomerase QueA [Vicinamibacterales bacterium]|jgi:S-adenosylmethionine:tRNA ribosyltransferase-isomerase|nr:tRNA preQ1(34) S-adenosylmethionine ribosyltransferase-isomerase QueA [Vicinamibacterales bacterium]
MDTSDFDFALPDDLIAQAPPEPRGASRLMVVDRASGSATSTLVSELPRWLRQGDVLVVNDTRVFPARLLGRRVPSGGAVECLLLRRLDADRWEALVHPGQKLRAGERFVCEGEGGRLHGTILAREGFGKRTIALKAETGEVDTIVDEIGHVPLPPYIKRPDSTGDRERYQTVFARQRGSVAAPTAGLHFTPDLLEALARAGVEQVAVTLHVGYGTFKPVRSERVEDHVVDPEEYEVTPDAAARIDRALAEGRRVIAVGTTTTRTLESAALHAEELDGPGAGPPRVAPGRRAASLFIHPGYRFRVVSGLFTNFHVPRSSLLMLVAAFAGRDTVLRAYAQAVAERFRFYSYGDAMLLL